MMNKQKKKCNRHLDNKVLSLTVVIPILLRKSTLDKVIFGLSI